MKLHVKTILTLDIHMSELTIIHIHTLEVAVLDSRSTRYRAIFESKFQLFLMFHCFYCDILPRKA